MKSKIENKHQCQVTLTKLKDLEQSLIKLFKIRDTLHPRQFLIRKHSLEITSGDLQQEIGKYQKNK